MTQPVNASDAPCRGRFAPTPSGPLHFGSVIAALGSYLQARSQQGEWLVRIDDIDRPRVQPGAADSILKSLERLGLYWDGEPVYQSRQVEKYDEVLQTLAGGGHTFACGCTRAEARGIYAGTCRAGLADGRQPRSLRLRVPDRDLTLTDRLSGSRSISLVREVGDFIIRRADHIVAYHLAVVVDDAEAGITEIVRGTDLLESTAPQILLQQLLDYPTPAYLHLPLALDGNNRKISKQNHAPAIAEQSAPEILWQALTFLGQAPATDLRQSACDDILAWAIQYWDIGKIPRHNTTLCRA